MAHDCGGTGCAGHDDCRGVRADFECYSESVKPFLTVGRYTINAQNVAYMERRDDGSVASISLDGMTFCWLSRQRRSNCPRCCVISVLPNQSRLASRTQRSLRASGRGWKNFSATSRRLRARSLRPAPCDCGSAHPPSRLCGNRRLRAERLNAGIPALGRVHRCERQSKVFRTSATPTPRTLSEDH